MYEKPLVRSLVETDTPMCLTEGSERRDFGVSSFAASCDCPCMCMIPCQCPCTCTCRCTCASIPVFVPPKDLSDLSSEAGKDIALTLGPDVKFRKDQGGGLMFDTNTWGLLRLNESAAQIVVLLESKPLRFDEVVVEIARFYGVAPELIRHDVAQVLTLLRSIGALQQSEV